MDKKTRRGFKWCCCTFDLPSPTFYKAQANIVVAMAPVKNGRVIFNEMPTGAPPVAVSATSYSGLTSVFDLTSFFCPDYPIPGRTTVYDESETIDLENVPLDGGILIKTLVVSIDPYLRRMMIDSKIPSSFVSVAWKDTSLAWCLHCVLAPIPHRSNVSLSLRAWVRNVK